jgi:hypothetical protein
MICIAKKETKKLTKSMQNINEVVILAFFLQEEMSNGLHISCSTLYTLNTNVKTIVNNDQQTSPWLCHHGIKPFLIGTSCFCSCDFVCYHPTSSLLFVLRQIICILDEKGTNHKLSS